MVLPLPFAVFIASEAALLFLIPRLWGTLVPMEKARRQLSAFS